MRYLKNFGLLFVVTSMLAACQDEEVTNSSELSSDDKSVKTSSEQSTTEIEEDISRSRQSAEDESNGEDTSVDSPSNIEKFEEKEIKNDNLNQIVEKAAEIESYNAELNISAVLDEMESRDLNAEVSFIDSEPPQLLLSSYGEDRTISREGNTYFNNGESWIDISDSVDVDLLYSVTYDNAVASFAEMHPLMEVEKTGENITYTYNGNDAEIYKTLESLVQVNFGEMDIESVNSTVQVVVNNESDLIEEINFKAEGTDDQGTFELDGAAAFTSFNEVKDIEFPEISGESE